MMDIPVPVLVRWSDASEDNSLIDTSTLDHKDKSFDYIGFLIDFNDTHATFITHFSHDETPEYHNRFDLPWRMIDQMIELRTGETLFTEEDLCRTES